MAIPSIRLFSGVSRAVLLLAALAGAHAEPLDAILARMDAAARQFHSFSASMKRTDVTTVLSESEVMYGTIHMKRSKAGVTGLMNFNDPNPHTIAIAGHTAQRYYPKAGVVEIYDTSKYLAVMDGYLLLGFGTTAAELAKAYNVKAGGTETLGSASTTRIELTPKSPEVLKLIRKIELWIPEGQSNPVQEKITDASKNTILVLYSDVKVNPELPDSAFELKLPAGVKKLTPNK
ncbi:MAG TPA: outer-membrane lipoprotein carrier protein LolA [Bryobacteraceae bacterium]|nr:outer-membrane lipoprotein carrier protein LolA [Bryobacteraceae bacterium]